MYPPSFQSQKYISESSCNVNILLVSYFSWSIFIFFITATFLTCVIMFTFTNFLSALLETLKGNSVNIPVVTVYSVTLCSIQILLRLLTLLFLGCTFIFVRQFPPYVFVQCHVVLSLGDKKPTQLYALLFVHELNDRCTMTSHYLTGRSHVTGHWSWCTFIICKVICGRKGQQQNLYFMQLLS